MSFEKRQAGRHRKIANLMLAFQALALFYMALHIAVSVLAFKLSSPVTALLTFVTLGFGDAYWGWSWAKEEGHGAIAFVALVAAATCFASWAGKPYFNRWAASFTSGMLSDAADEIEHATRQQAQTKPVDDQGENRDA